MFESIAFVVRLPFYLLFLVLITLAGALLFELMLTCVGAFLEGILLLYPFWFFVVLLRAALTNDKEKLKLLNPWKVYPFWNLMIVLWVFMGASNDFLRLLDLEIGIGTILKLVIVPLPLVKRWYRFANRFLIGGWGS